MSIHANRSTGQWRSHWRTNPVAVVLAAWWLVFAAISFYWAAGGMWLIDTAIQAQGVELAHQRPGWIVALVTATGIVKLLPVLFAYLVVTPVGRRIPTILYALAGFGAGGACFVYGMIWTIPLIRYLARAEDGSAYTWMRLLVWMPSFWVGGLLLITTTIMFLRRTPRRPARSTD